MVDALEPASADKFAQAVADLVEKTSKEDAVKADLIKSTGSTSGCSAVS